MEEIIRDLEDNIVLLGYILAVNNIIVIYTLGMAAAAGWYARKTYMRTGFGSIGLLMMSGSVILAISFVSLAISAIPSLDIPFGIRAMFGIGARVLQGIACTLLAVGFWQYSRVVR